MSVMKLDSVLILFAHGSRAPQTLEEMGKLAAKVQFGRKSLKVIPAFLELTKPDLSEAIAEAVSFGVAKIDILPLFLFTGKHVLEDIPALLKANGDRYPNTKLILHKPIGHHSGFADFLLQACGLP
jgi:sirohydrochlorin cobaltochelatase